MNKENQQNQQSQNQSDSTQSSQQSESNNTQRERLDYSQDYDYSRNVKSYDPRNVNNNRTKTKLIALMHNGDCTDCSCIHLVLPFGVNLAEEKANYRNRAVKNQSFNEWLIERGARHPNESEMEEVDVDFI